MTVIVAQNTKDKIILAADTGSFYGSSGHKRHLENHIGRLKICTANDITYASTGSVAEINNFRLFCSSKKPESSTELGMQRFFVDFGTFRKNMNLNQGDNALVANYYFIVYEKKLFHFQAGGVAEIFEGDFATDGAGYRESYMAMHLGKSPKEAVDLTIEMNIWTSGKTQVVEIKK